MRNAIKLPSDLVLTTDNSAAIGEKSNDLVCVDDEVVAYFAARVTLLEQWAAKAQPISIIVHNFSGDKSWDKYMTGIQKVFEEIGLQCPPITGSTESNMETLQSALAVTMIGEPKVSVKQEVTWFVYGKPCVGDEVLEESGAIADLNKIYEAMKQGLVHDVWPVGSSGIAAECNRLRLICCLEGWDIEKSAGPATSVLLGIGKDQIKDAKVHLGKYFAPVDGRLV